MRRLFFFFYGAIKIHRDGVVRQRSIPACTLLSSARHRDPGPAPRRPEARPRRPLPALETEGHAARPRDAGRLGEKRNLRGEEAGCVLLWSPAFTQRPPSPAVAAVGASPWHPPTHCSSSDGLALSRALRALGRL